MDKRPVNLDITTIRFPVMAIVSILHRISGLFLIAGFGVLLSLLHFALASPQEYSRVVTALANPLCRGVVWAVLSALIYHSCAGIRHLMMDMGLGESLKGGEITAYLALASSVLLILLAGVWVLSW